MTDKKKRELDKICEELKEEYKQCKTHKEKKEFKEWFYRLNIPNIIKDNKWEYITK